MQYIKLIILIFLIIFFSCNEEIEEIDDMYVRANIFEQGYINCFPEKTFNKKKQAASCELSGVAYYRDSLFLINDKRIPATTPLMACRFKIHFHNVPTDKLGGINVLNARKLEAITITPKQKYMFMITAFDRFDNKKPKDDRYNILLYKKLGANKDEKIAYLTERDGISSSLIMRKMIRKALRTRKFKEGPPYFKISGLAALPNNILLIGVREIGYDKDNNEYSMTIIGASYDIVDEEFYFKEDLEVVYHFNPSRYSKKDLKPIGLTGMEYDIHNKCLYLITAYENEKKDEKKKTDKDIGGYLWVLSIKDFMENRPPKLVVLEDNTPLLFAHKPGGVAIIDSDKIIVVHDDDRIEGRKNITDKKRGPLYR